MSLLWKAGRAKVIFLHHFFHFTQTFYCRFSAFSVRSLWIRSRPSQRINTDLTGFVFLEIKATCAERQSHGSAQQLRPLSVRVCVCIRTHVCLSVSMCLTLSGNHDWMWKESVHFTSSPSLILQRINRYLHRYLMTWHPAQQQQRMAPSPWASTFLCKGHTATGALSCWENWVSKRVRGWICLNHALSSSCI